MHGMVLEELAVEAMAELPTAAARGEVLAQTSAQTLAERPKATRTCETPSSPRGLRTAR